MAINRSGLAGDYGDNNSGPHNNELIRAAIILVRRRRLPSLSLSLPLLNRACQYNRERESIKQQLVYSSRGK